MSLFGKSDPTEEEKTAERERLISVLAAREDELAKLIAENERLTNENAQLRTELDAAREDLDDAKKEIETLTADRDERREAAPVESDDKPINWMQRHHRTMVPR